MRQNQKIIIIKVISSMHTTSFVAQLCQAFAGDTDVGLVSHCRLAHEILKRAISCVLCPLWKLFYVKNKNPEELESYRTFAV